jgi:nicotinamide mononucleotide transporter
LEYQAKPQLWLVSVAMPLVSMWIYFSKGLYADFAINIYYVAIAIYGWIAWTIHLSRPKQRKLPIRLTPKPVLIGCTAVFAVLWLVIAKVLINFTNSSVPWADAFTTALSIVALWMLARKYAEQWLAWIVVDAVCVGLYIYKDIYFYAALYAAYTIIAVFGYRKWLGIMATEAE